MMFDNGPNGRNGRNSTSYRITLQTITTHCSILIPCLWCLYLCLYLCLCLCLLMVLFFRRYLNSAQRQICRCSDWAPFNNFDSPPPFLPTNYSKIWNWTFAFASLSKVIELFCWQNENIVNHRIIFELLILNWLNSVCYLWSQSVCERGIRGAWL